MPSPPSEQGSHTSRSVRRLIGGALLSCVLFIVFWVTIFDATTAALVGVGMSGGMVAAGSVSETLSSIVDIILEAVLSLFTAIGDFFSALFSG